MADYYLGCVGLAPGQKPAIAVPRDTQMLATSYLKNHGIEGRDLLVIHPGSGSPQKNWPLDLFYEIATHWTGMGGEVTFLLGPAEDGLPTGLERWPALRHLPLSTLAAVLSKAAAFVGNDSGVTHLAAAVGATTFALFRGSDPAVWAPRGERVMVFAKGRVSGEVTAAAWDCHSLADFLLAKVTAAR